MAITFTAAAITVSNGTYSFLDIYNASIAAGNKYCSKLGTSYLITNDLIIGDGTNITVLQDSNISATIEGDLFQINRNATLKFGTIDSNTGSTSNGCYISCPNIALVYGFGSNNRVNGVTQSGDIFLFDSFIDIFGFWGFFGGATQHVEVIDCLVNGFGRVEGPNTILRNITTQKSHGRYGVLAAKGTIKEYANITSKASLASGTDNYSIYFNPLYAPASRIIKGVYDGYVTGLVYMEAGNGNIDHDTVTFVDSDIRNGYGARFTTGCRLLHVFTFNPTFLDGNNNILSDVQVDIKDQNGVSVYTGLSDAVGTISVELLYHEENSVSSTTYSFYDITATKGTLTVTRRYRAGVTYTNFPFFIETAAASTGTSCDCATIDASLDTKLAALQLALENKITTNTTKIDNMSTNVNATLIALGDSVAQNKTIIEGKNGAKMFL